jgi:hypothetical protein
MQSSEIRLSISAFTSSHPYAIIARIVMPVCDGPRFTQLLSDFLDASFGEMASEKRLYTIRTYSPIRLELYSHKMPFKSHEELAREIADSIFKAMSQSLYDQLGALGSWHSDPTVAIGWVKSVLGEFEQSVAGRTQVTH